VVDHDENGALAVLRPIAMLRIEGSGLSFGRAAVCIEGMRVIADEGKA
jgi:hypothetical protein